MPHLQVLQHCRKAYISLQSLSNLLQACLCLCMCLLEARTGSYNCTCCPAAASP